MIIQAVLFDFDDTLTTPGRIDYVAIRRDIGCPADVSILDFIASLDKMNRQKANRCLDEHEMSAAAKAVPAEGAESLLTWLSDSNVGKGILTRNTLRAVHRSLENFQSFAPEDFDIIVTRDDGIAVKPDPAGVLHAADFFGINATNVLMVGDYVYDIQAGKAAGAVTAFIASRTDRHIPETNADYRINQLMEIVEIVSSHS